MGGRFGMMKMVKTKLAVLMICLTCAVPAAAQDRVTLGWGRMFTNDALGDRHDRWRTGSYSVSRIRGYSWSGELPQNIGEILEFRARAETIASASLVTPAAGDRRYAGVLAFGLHTHFGWQGNEIAVGADLAFVGPQTQISRFQGTVHDLLGLADATVYDDQLGNAVYPTLVAELGRTVEFGENARLRPFVEAQAGLETFVRVGGDLVIGQLGRDDLMLRDASSGQRFRAIDGSPGTGVSFVLGGDVTQVFASKLLPNGDDATLSDIRARLRAGVHWQGEKASIFYGLSYLGREFEQQPEGQVLGSLSLNLKF